MTKLSKAQQKIMDRAYKDIDEARNAKELMKYIPKEYKQDVLKIYRSDKEWNEHTKRWNTLVTVEWSDGETNTYQNASYMKNLLKDFGR